MDNKHYGVVLFSNEITSHNIQDVRNAAKRAGIGEEKVHDIKPRNSFIRAIRELKKRKIIEERGADELLLHKFTDVGSDAIQFQFSRSFSEENGVTYDKAAVVSFNKESHEIRCDNPDVRALAVSLYSETMYKYSVQDINALVKRVIEDEGASRLLLRDAVYFIPVQFADTVLKLKNFFSYLNIPLFQLTVNEDSGQKGNILKAAVADIRKTVTSFELEVKKLKEDGDLTPRIARNRLTELKKELERYRGIALALRTDLATIIEDAQDAGSALYEVGVDDVDLLISAVQRGGVSSPLVCDLVNALSVPEVAKVEDRDLVQVDLPE